MLETKGKGDGKMDHHHHAYQMPAQMPTNAAVGAAQAPMMPYAMPCCVEPYVLAALQSLVGTRIVVKTKCENYAGRLLDVKPDHIVVKCMDATFFIRIKKITSIMPIQRYHEYKKGYGHESSSMHM
jgi:hypothetical protein